jgi:hypothetical protein
MALETVGKRYQAQVLPSPKTRSLTSLTGMPAIVPDELLEKARRINRSCGRQIDFLRSGEVHSKLTRSQMLERCRVTIAELLGVCRLLNPLMPTGYNDPDDEFADYCVDTWKYELSQMERRVKER